MSNDGAMITSGINMSIRLLKDASNLVSKIPHLSAITQILLYAINVYDVRVLSLFRRPFSLMVDDRAIRRLNNSKRSGR
jgi:hypothetical protein